jgi:hypothetical protein
MNKIILVKPSFNTKIKSFFDFLINILIFTIQFKLFFKYIFGY